MNPRISTARISSWARLAMSPDSWRTADWLRLIVVAYGDPPSPNGPWVARHPRLLEPLTGPDVDALVARAAAEVTRD